MNVRDLHDVLQQAVLLALRRFWGDAAMPRRLDMLMEQHWRRKRDAAKNPLVKSGEKYFSQNDEDGITLEIVRRIGARQGRFAEFGVGDGLENNTLILLALGWSGLWIGGEDLAVKIPPGSTKLKFMKSWVTAENCAALLRDGLSGAGGVDLLSVDLDGNDLFVLSALMKSGIRPSVVIVEYNGKFPPPIRWSIAYDPQHKWNSDDYQGASLQSLCDAMGEHNYIPVACNVTGVNAFFVDAKFKDKFADVPEKIEELFVPADYSWFFGRGHRTSSKTIERFL